MMAIRSDLVIWVLRNFSRGGLCADLVGERHRGHVEEHDHQAAVLVLDIAGLLGRDLVGGDGLSARRLGGFSRSLGRARRGSGIGAARLFQALELDELDFLRFAVLRAR